MIRLTRLPRNELAAIIAACGIAGLAWFNCRGGVAPLQGSQPNGSESAIRLSLVADTGESNKVPGWPGYLRFSEDPQGQYDPNGSRIVFKSADLRTPAQTVNDVPPANNVPAANSVPPAPVEVPKSVVAPSSSAAAPSPAAPPAVVAEPKDAEAPKDISANKIVIRFNDAAAPMEITTPNVATTPAVVTAPAVVAAPPASDSSVATSKSSSVAWGNEEASSAAANASPGGSVVPVVKIPAADYPLASAPKVEVHTPAPAMTPAEIVAADVPTQGVKPPVENTAALPPAPEAPQPMVQATPAVSNPVAQSPVAQTPAVETPQPMVQSPAVQAPAVQTPMVQAPIVQTPAMQDQVARTPAPEAPQPTIQAPVVQTPVVQNQVVQNPVVQTPAPEAPQPMVQIPAAPSVIAQAPVMQQAPAAQVPPPRVITRSRALEQMAKQADSQIRHGFELANRGGYFAARAEFTSALRLVSQALDGEEQTNSHSESLAAALTALKEAQDFIPPANKVEADLDVPGIVGSHVTPVLKHASAGELHPMLALSRYHTYAQDQFALAVGHEVAGSMALYALAKDYAMLASEGNCDIPVPEPKAIVCYHASLMVCSQNYMAANDLGALLARDGDYVDARQMLEHSVTVRCCSSNLANLARVYQQLGEPQLAAKANEKAQYAASLEAARLKELQGSSNAEVRWVDPDTLAQAASGANLPGQPTRNASADPSRPQLGMRNPTDQQNIQR